MMRSLATTEGNHRILVMAVTLVLLPACSDTPTRSSSDRNASEVAVTRRVTAEGARNPASNAPPEIDRKRAEQIASIWARDFAPMLKEHFESERGGPIDWSQLGVCDPTYYVTTPFRPVGAAVPLGVRRAVGPWWLVTICGTTEPQLTVAVSAWNTDLTIENDRLAFPNPGGNHFISRAIPVEVTRDAFFRVSPERARKLARQVTGVEPVGPPELVSRPFVMPQYAHWRLKLERSSRLRVEATGAIVERDQVYVGVYGPDARVAVAIANPDGPTTYPLRYYSSRGVVATRHLKVRDGYTLSIEAISTIHE